ncbi:MAG: SUF system NifU family Fe-S cluster assembly protein [Candidatus Marinimicrobia bacterium]|nr:SUF system NifU family Fe-S cluster assembly protein [Candidatus Neomarinimicrobiota bacterium]MCF7840523.1 SUF system NifU family Fe-S cluster assembly protein [Candidatus Neomarinimicrobiota bacterium]
MSEIRELYQELILDHNRNPQNFKPLPGANHHSEGFNPLCGDHYHIYIKTDENNIIEKITFDGKGCAISKASASLMTSFLKGKTVEEAIRAFESFHDVVTGKIDPETGMAELGKLAVFAGVRDFPVRVKCASLAWHTMKAALTETETVISTE